MAAETSQRPEMEIDITKFFSKVIILCNYLSNCASFGVISISALIEMQVLPSQFLEINLDATAEGPAR